MKWMDWIWIWNLDINKLKMYPIELNINSFKPIIVYLEDEFKTYSRCKLCKEIIYRATTEKWKKMPIQKIEKVDSNWAKFELYESHFTHCPYWDRFRNKK